MSWRTCSLSSSSVETVGLRLLRSGLTIAANADDRNVPSTAFRTVRLPARLLRPGTNGVCDNLLEHAQIHVLQGFELDAISGDFRLSEPRSICLGQVFLVLKTYDVDRYSRRIGAQADLVELSAA